MLKTKPTILVQTLNETIFDLEAKTDVGPVKFDERGFATVTLEGAVALQIATQAFPDLGVQIINPDDQILVDRYISESVLSAGPGGIHRYNPGLPVKIFDEELAGLKMTASDRCKVNFDESGWANCGEKTAIALQEVIPTIKIVRQEAKSVPGFVGLPQSPDANGTVLTAPANRPLAEMARDVLAPAPSPITIDDEGNIFHNGVKIAQADPNLYSVVKKDAERPLLGFSMSGTGSDAMVVPIDPIDDDEPEVNPYAKAPDDGDPASFDKDEIGETPEKAEEVHVPKSDLVARTIEPEDDAKPAKRPYTRKPVPA